MGQSNTKEVPGDTHTLPSHKNSTKEIAISTKDFASSARTMSPISSSTKDFARGARTMSQNRTKELAGATRSYSRNTISSLTRSKSAPIPKRRKNLDVIYDPNSEVEYYLEKSKRRPLRFLEMWLMVDAIRSLPVTVTQEKKKPKKKKMEKEKRIEKEEENKRSKHRRLRKMWHSLELKKCSSTDSVGQSAEKSRLEERPATVMSPDLSHAIPRFYSTFSSEGSLPRPLLLSKDSNSSPGSPDGNDRCHLPSLPEITPVRTGGNATLVENPTSKPLFFTSDDAYDKVSDRAFEDRDGEETRRSDTRLSFTMDFSPMSSDVQLLTPIYQAALGDYCMCW